MRYMTLALLGALGASLAFNYVQYRRAGGTSPDRAVDVPALRLTEEQARRITGC